jgi:hypothetical protein
MDANVRGSGLPILVEVKRFCTRAVEEGTECFFLKLQDKLQLARTDLMIQSRYLFNAHTQQHSVILMACAGNWWDYRVVNRSDVRDYEDYNPSGELPEDDSDGDEVLEGADNGDDFEEGLVDLQQLAGSSAAGSVAPPSD